MITLYDYWRSSAAYRVRMALNLLNLRYKSQPVDLVKGEHRGADNVARNPQGLVPTLDIDGLRLTQSLAIIEYLDETRGGLLPKDPAPRAHVRALSYAIAMETAPVCNLTVRDHVGSMGVMTSEAWTRHYITKGLTAFEAMLTTASRYCHGDSVTMADLCLVPQIYNAERVGIDVTSFPQTAKIVANLREIPAIAAAHPDRVKP
ncbi:maleylacetoacetate isomerase [Cypionkella sp.]|uniref:maleylacetoacetate isomerase n=1 Tax=Cypionkella sp. TaxID=2811411 RepID=UPI0027285BEC|nr:maleylacetoacetate isomerase [Cypionkella sp.]MDO8984601.1 maleylacetoacetate isomerase [Cypionkella sp.]MDP2049354.1 maleylacetoacetate isomerase [Cypionkella sp.]